MKTVTILGIQLDSITEAQAVERICQAARQKQKYTVATINPEFIMAAQANSDFKHILNQADLRLPDGVGVMWAANLQKYSPHLPGKYLKVLEIWSIAFYYGLKTFLSLKFRTANLPQQVSGSNLTLSLSQVAASQNLSLFLLGEKEGIASQAAQVLQETFPGLSIAGTFAGDGSINGDDQTRRQISAHPADIILVAYGAPKQEFWINRNLPHLPTSVAIGVGGTFRFLSGDIRRAPLWIQRLGFEWLFRLALEPWRWRRQLALPKFIITVTRQLSSQIS